MISTIKSREKPRVIRLLLLRLPKTVADRSKSLSPYYKKRRKIQNIVERFSKSAAVVRR